MYMHLARLGNSMPSFREREREREGIVYIYEFLPSQYMYVWGGEGREGGKPEVMECLALYWYGMYMIIYNIYIYTLQYDDDGTNTITPLTVNRPALVRVGKVGM